MSRSGAQQSPITVGDFDPQADKDIEFDFSGREIAGRYTVRDQIGGGGMADLTRATDEQLGIEVALKLLKPRMASDELRARMVQEAQAAAQVRHANLVRVFGTGALDSTAYIVMELIEGPNLEQYLREYRSGRMPCREALELLIPTLDALHEIHERGYVHRDIKTGNIIVARTPGRPATAIVIDLGLVKPDRALRNATSPPTTEVGRMLCTPGYTSPEQAAGKPVDRRADIYSMAVTLYRVLAGRLPFKDARGQPLALLAKHIYDIPTMLAEAAGTAEIPVAVAAVIEGALSKDPAGRPQTMLEFADELRAAAQSIPSPKITRLRRTRDLLLAFGAGMALAWLATPSKTCPPAAAAMSRSVPAAAPEVVPPAQTEVSVVAPEPAPHMDDPPPSAEGATISSLEAPRPADLDSSPPAADPDNRSPPAGTDKRGAPTRTAGYRRALAARTPEVQACAKVAAGGLDELTVAVHIETSRPSLRADRRRARNPAKPLRRCSPAAHASRRSLRAGHLQTRLRLAADTASTVTAMLLSFVLAMALVPAPTVLSSEAAEHNKQAMMFYDNGQLALAFAEFHAGYLSMPDARADRAGRESLLGSMRATLLEMHAASGEAAPLCRLATVLQAHADALAAVYPEAPDMLEIRSARARHDEVTAQLAALGPDACAAPPPSPPPPTASESIATPAPTPVVAPAGPPPPRYAGSIPPRHLRIAGAVTLGLGVVLLGVMTYGIVGEAHHETAVDTIDAGAAGRPLTLGEHTGLLDHRGEARSARTLAIGTGVAAGVTTALGTTLFLLARRSARAQRWSAAPWWSPAGAGLTLRVQFGVAR